MNLATWLRQSALAWPGRPAIHAGDRLFADYRGLAARAAALGAGLAARGVGKGDRVAIFLANRPEYLEILHACWWIGAAAVPVNCKLPPAEAAWILDHSGAALALTDDGASVPDAPCPELAVDGPDYASMIAPGLAPDAPLPAPEALPGEALAWLFYTSGTTGRPKGVMLSHANLMHMTLCFGTDVDRILPGDVSLYAAPMSHGAGLYALAYIRAAAAHLVPDSRGFDPAEIIRLAGAQGNLCFFAAPTMIKRLTAAARAQGWDGTGLRTVVYGGGPMYGADIDEALDVLGPRFVQIYGQGESPMTITALSRDLVADETHPDWRARRDSVGQAQACAELAILGPDRRPLPPGEAGEIAVRAPTVMLGYWRNPEATAETLRDGWLLTGDLGRLSADGFLTLTDRSKDVIISGGTNIYPREVEEALLTHPEVFEVAVVGRPDPEWGEAVVAFVAPVPGAACAPEALDAWCRGRIAGFKRPKAYRLVEALPKNSYGKVLKTELRALLAAEDGDTP
ncbi:MAG: AMP-dependent synthetase [Rhodobacteraceae bacterium]|nr:AMP-dependent synthetase [Paracoccaceae bacterium]